MPGLTTISLTKDSMKARDSVSSLAFRNSPISKAWRVMVSTSSRTTRLSESMDRASSAAASRRCCRSRWSRIRGLKSSMSMSVVSTRL